MSKYQLHFLFLILLIVNSVAHSAEDKIKDNNADGYSSISSNDKKKNSKGGWSSSGGDIDFNDNHVIKNSDIVVAGGDSSGGAVGGSGGTSGGGSKIIKRSIASVDKENVEDVSLNAALKCLKKLNSTYVPKSITSNEDTINIKKEIMLSVEKLKFEKREVDFIRFPDCSFYANDTNDPALKNLFFKKRTPSSKIIIDSIPSGVSK